jgi:glycine cleavage system H protein
LDGSPELVNSDAYGQGWMIKCSIANPDEVTGLMSAAAYKELVH